MRPTEILVNEHSVIRQVLDSFSLALEKLEKGDRPPAKFFEKGVEFARAFSDEFHHHKEEYLMFGRLAQKKDGKLDAQIDSLRYQHERGRGIVNDIEKALPAYSEGEDATTTILMENVAAYTALLRHHIHREDHVFYPMVDKELSEGDQQYLLDEFKKEDAKTSGNSLDNGRKLAAEMGSML